MGLETGGEVPGESYLKLGGVGEKNPKTGEADATGRSRVEKPRGAQQGRAAYRSTAHFTSLINNAGTAPAKPGGAPKIMANSSNMEACAVGSGPGLAVAPQTSGSRWPASFKDRVPSLEPSSDAVLL